MECFKFVRIYLDMLKLSITSFFFLSVLAFAQNIDFDSIKVNTQNENSDFFYERLLYKFKFDPTTLTDQEMKNLYYGKLFSKYKPSYIDIDYLEFTANFGKNNFKKAIDFGEKYLEKDPTNPEVLSLLAIAYSKKDKDSQKYPLYSMQAKRLLDIILQSGDGKTKETAFLVNSIGEEYFIAAVLGKDIRTFKRTSFMQKDGTVDGFTKKKDALYFKVLQTTSDFD